MSAEKLTQKEAAEIGKMCRDADDGNILVGSFAAELAGESYPFSRAMAEIMFKGFTDEQLGRKFAVWCDAGREGETT